MIAKLVALTIIMVVLILFSLIILKSLSTVAGIRIRSDMNGLLKAYDKIIDAKSDEIARLTKEMCKLENNILKEHTTPIGSLGMEEKISVSGATVLSRKVTYRSAYLSDSYENIKNNFTFNEKDREILTNLIAEDREPSKLRGEAAERLAEALSFDTVFKLSRLSSEAQLEFLDINLKDEDWVLLEAYCGEIEGKNFDITLFKDWLMDVAVFERSTISICCGDLDLSREAGIKYQKQICEGLQVRVGNRLYDYSIKESEII